MTSESASPGTSRRRLDVARRAPLPARYVVWELTLRATSLHALRLARRRRSTNELSTAEALASSPSSPRCEAREVSLIGGEAYLHAGFLEIIAALATRGDARDHDDRRARHRRGSSRGRWRRLASTARRVSIDGLEATHDLMRAARGSFRSASAAVGHLADAGMSRSPPTRTSIG